MQKDFHYCATRVIAEKCGFSASDAQIIAFASQFVDDAHHYKKMKISGGFDIDYPRYDGVYFDPICTAHRGLQMIKSLQKEVQRKIFIPFHFIPSEEYSGVGSYDYITRPDSKIARDLVIMALKELKEEKENRLQMLIKLGIAIHSYVDTWSHQGFSGRHNSLDNDIENIELFENNEWHSLSFSKQIEYNILPDIGHAEAYSLPDESHRIWRYEKCFTKEVVCRNNIDICMDAAEHLFELINKYICKNGVWERWSHKLKRCFSESLSLKDKWRLYQKTFPEINFFYDEDSWVEDAFGDDDVFDEIDNNILVKTGLKRPLIEFYGDMKWVYFHIEAHNQREYVCSKIRFDLL